MKRSSSATWPSRAVRLLFLLVGIASAQAQLIPRYYQVEDLRPRILAAFNDHLPAWGGAEHVQMNLAQMNNAGDVAGSIGPDCFVQGCDWSGGQQRYFVRRQGQVVDLTALVAATFGAVGGYMQGACGPCGQIGELNEQGQLVGVFNRGGLLRVFHYHDGGVEDIGHPFDGLIHGNVNPTGGLMSWRFAPLVRINSQGMILANSRVGSQPVSLDTSSSDPNGSNPIYARTLVYDLARHEWRGLPASFEGTLINDLGEVGGGIADTDGGGGSNPAIWRAGTIVGFPSDEGYSRNDQVVAFNSAGELATFQGRWLDRGGNLIRLFPAIGNINWIDHELTSGSILRDRVHLYSRTEGPLVPTAFLPHTWETIPWPLPSDMIVIDGEFTSFGRINDGGQLLAGSGRIATPSPPRIVRQPTSVAVRLGMPWSLSLEARGALSYRWHFNGQPRSDESGQSILDRATGTTLTNSASLPGHAGDYFVVLTNITGSETSQVVRVEILSPPTISRQPSDFISCVGGSVEISIDGTGVPTPTIQWRHNGADLEGRTGAVLRLEGIVSTNAGSYTARVSNSEGSRTSEPATLTVSMPPTVTQPLAGQTVATGGFTTFDAGSGGNAPLAWQWFRGGSPLSGETSDRLVIRAATRSDTGDYSVVVNNGCGSVTNGPVSLTVLPPPPRLGNTRLFAGFDIIGEVGLRYRIETREDLNAAEWQPLEELVLTNSPQLFLDLDSGSRSRRLYRASLVGP